MAIKKVKSAQNKIKDPVAKAPDLEAKRKKFQQAAATVKPVHTPKKTQPKHHTSRKRTVIILVGALLAIIGSVSVAYGVFFWQQSPDKMVADALSNAASSQSVSYDIEVNSPTMSLAAISGSYKDGNSQAEAVIRTALPGALATVTGSVMATNKNLYVKVPNATEVVREILPESQQKVAGLLLPLIQNDINDKWIRMAIADTAFFQGVTNVSSCVVESARNLSVNQQARMLMTRAYMQNAFFAAKEVKTDKNRGTYQLTIDRTKFHAFIDAITRSSPAIPFSKCNKELAAVKASAVDTSVIELVIDKTTRTLTQVTVSTPGKDAMTVMISPVFDQTDAISEPTEGVTRFDDLKAQFFTVFSLTQPK